MPSHRYLATQQSNGVIHPLRFLWGQAEHLGLISPFPSLLCSLLQGFFFSSENTCSVTYLLKTSSLALPGNLYPYIPYFFLLRLFVNIEIDLSYGLQRKMPTLSIL